MLVQAICQAHAEKHSLPNDSPNLAELLVCLLGSSVFFSAILLQN